MHLDTYVVSIIITKGSLLVFRLGRVRCTSQRPLIIILIIDIDILACATSSFSTSTSTIIGSIPKHLRSLRA